MKSSRARRRTELVMRSDSEIGIEPVMRGGEYKAK